MTRRQALKYLVAVAEVIAIILGIEAFLWVSEKLHAGEPGEAGAEKEVLVLGLVAYLIILSTSLAARIGLPTAIVEIFAGLAAAFYGVKGGEALKLLSGIGANILLFMAGLEVEVQLMRRNMRRTLTLGSLEWLLPALIAIIIFGGSLSLEGDLILAAALGTTSVALTFAVLKDFGLLRSEHGQTALTAAMLTDVLGMIALNLATAVIDWRLALYTMVLLAAMALQPVMPRVSGRPFEFEVRLVIMALIVLGAASEALGMHSVLTSFILGVIVGETVRHRKVLMEKLEGLATGFFTPFFFIAAGMSMEPKALSSAALAGIAAGLLIFAVKALIAYAYYRVHLNLRPKRAFMLSSSLTPLLTVSIVGGLTGYQQGLIGVYEYGLIMTAVVTTATLSTVVASLAARR